MIPAFAESLKWVQDTQNVKGAETLLVNLEAFRGQFTDEEAARVREICEGIIENSEN